MNDTGSKDNIWLLIQQITSQIDQLLERGDVNTKIHLEPLQNKLKALV